MDSTLGRAVLARHRPSTWVTTVPNSEVLKELRSYDHEFDYVKNKIRQTLEVDVNRVFRVENPYLFGCYLLKKEECQNRCGYCQEMELFHATDVANIPSITTDNLDWRRSVRTKFGQGVSFSPKASYANTYCNRNNSAQRAMILAQVLFRTSCEGHYGMVLPSGNADTSTGNCCSVYVKYCDNEFYPKYVAYYMNQTVIRQRNPTVIRRYSGWELFD